MLILIFILTIKNSIVKGFLRELDGMILKFVLSTMNFKRCVSR